jgi:chemotaxis protein CheY-P-specific phosphatase CheC
MGEGTEKAFSEQILSSFSEAGASSMGHRKTSLSEITRIERVSNIWR